MYTKKPCLKYKYGTAEYCVPVFTSASDVPVSSYTKKLKITVGNASYYSPLQDRAGWNGKALKICAGTNKLSPFAEQVNLKLSYTSCDFTNIGPYQEVCTHTTTYCNIKACLQDSYYGYSLTLCNPITICFYNQVTGTWTCLGQIASGSNCATLANVTVPYSTKHCFGYISNIKAEKTSTEALVTSANVTTAGNNYCCTNHNSSLIVGQGYWT